MLKKSKHLHSENYVDVNSVLNFQEIYQKIKDILIIVNKGQLNQYKKLFPVSKNLGLNLSFKEQKKRDMVFLGGCS